MPATDSRPLAFFCEPYPHFECADFLDPDTADALLSWLEARKWLELGIEEYEGYSDVPLSASNLPEACSGLVAPDFLVQLRQLMLRFFRIDSTGNVRVTAHRIRTGGSLSAHSDVSHIRFTHRLLVQLNRGWTGGNGGLLCLYDGSPHAHQPPCKFVAPVHRSAFAFEVSERAFHSVTPVLRGQRYTLSYTFYPSVNGGPDERSRTSTRLSQFLRATKVME
jgi:hypothetical protein